MLSGKAKLIALIPIIIVVITLVLGWMHFTRIHDNILSQEATLTAPVTNMSSTVPGRIAQIHVSENEQVTKGQLLFTIEDDVYKLLVEQLTADLRGARALHDTQMRTIAAQTANAEIANGQIARAQVNLELAAATLARLIPLQPKGYVTDQAVQDARTLERDATVSLEQALLQKQAADALVSSPEESLALVQGRVAALALAQHNLDNTKIYAPHDGRVVGLTVSSGQFMISGQSLFTLVNTGEWYATSLYLETELERLPIGSCVTVYVLSDKSIPVKGRVQGIGWGVADMTSIDLPMSLPYIPKQLDWVRIAQRFPVRIELIDPPVNLMRVGASASTVVHHGDKC